MYNTKICPLCGSLECEQYVSQDNFYVGYKCKSFDEEKWAYISDGILEDTTDIRGKCLDMIYNKLMRESYCLIDGKRYKWHFYFDSNEKMESFEKKKSIKLILHMRFKNILLILQRRWMQPC